MEHQQKALQVRRGDKGKSRGGKMEGGRGAERAGQKGGWRRKERRLKEFLLTACLQLSIVRRNVQDLQIMLQDTNARMPPFQQAHRLFRRSRELTSKELSMKPRSSFIPHERGLVKPVGQVELSAEKSKFDNLNAELLDRRRTVQQVVKQLTYAVKRVDFEQLESKVRQVNLDLEQQQQARIFIGFYC
eukprot:758407-Hanusia_phi.AAC.1